MRLLLDTHVALWAILDPDRLTYGTRHLIESPDNDVLVSIVSAWEIAIKNSLRGAREGVGISVHDALQSFDSTDFELLPLEARHVIEYEGMGSRRGDPYDRLIFSQAKSDSLMLITHDPKVAAFDRRIVLKI